jgi:lambda repressor-like predicted transcriptional regulator
MRLPSPRYDLETLRRRKALGIGMLARQAGLSYRTAKRLVLGLPTRPSSKQRLAASLGLPPEAIKWGE